MYVEQMKTISIIDKTIYNLTADILDIQRTHYRRDKGKNSAIAIQRSSKLRYFETRTSETIRLITRTSNILTTVIDENSRSLASTIATPTFRPPAREVQRD